MKRAILTISCIAALATFNSSVSAADVKNTCNDEFTKCRAASANDAAKIAACYERVESCVIAIKKSDISLTD